MKLTGQKYLDYWKARMAKGPVEAGHSGDSDARVAEQGRVFFSAMLPVLNPLRRHDRIFEFGSGYGRMLRLMREFYPNALLTGVDLSPDAVRKSWRDESTLIYNAAEVPEFLMDCGITFDLSYTVTALQHVTDDARLAQAVVGLAATLVPGGTILMVENVARPGADHVRDMDPEDYRRLFPGFEWYHEGSVTYKDQKHAVLAGRKR